MYVKTIVLLTTLLLKEPVIEYRKPFMIPSKLNNTIVTINLDEYIPIAKSPVKWNNVQFNFVYSKPYTFSLHKFLDGLAKNENSSINLCIFNFKKLEK